MRPAAIGQSRIGWNRTYRRGNAELRLVSEKDWLLYLYRQGQGYGSRMWKSNDKLSL
jgi:hypothetical protein